MKLSVLELPIKSDRIGGTQANAESNDIAERRHPGVFLQKRECRTVRFKCVNCSTLSNHLREGPRVGPYERTYIGNNVTFSNETGQNINLGLGPFAIKA
jgi:hypothetical protein